MNKKIFTEEQINELLKNKNVARYNGKSITYREDFKISAVKKHHEGLPPSEIFKQAGFNIDWIGRGIPKQCLKRWRKIFRDKGNQGLLVEARGGGKGSGRPKTKWANEKEKIEYLEAQVAYLKAENNFLVKLRKKS